MDYLNFSKNDSIAVWVRKDNKNLHNLSINEIENYFQDSYKYVKNNHMFF